MAGLSDAAREQVLDEIFNAGSGTFPSADLYLQLHNGDPGLAGTTNKVSHTRVQVAFGAAGSDTLSNTSNVDVSSMPAVGAPGVVAFSLHNHLTNDDAWYVDWFSTVSGLAQVDDEDLTNNDIESPTHGLVADDRVTFLPVEGLSLPTGLSQGTLYWVIATGLADDTFRVSTSQGGGAVDITAEGQCIWKKVVGKTTNLNDIFRIAAGDLDIFAD